MTNSKLLYKSMYILQKEKLLVIKKELLHLFHITDFYQNNNGTDNNLAQDQRSYISYLMHNDINELLKRIEELNKDINEYQSRFIDRKSDHLSFLVMYRVINEDISDIIKYMNIIQNKLIQFQTEHFNQYLPIPNINKRYSGKGFLDYLKDFHVSILETTLKKRNIFFNIFNSVKSEYEIKLIFYWGYRDSFVAQSISNEEKTVYITIPYWNYEIPFMLPIITHELGHKIIKIKNSFIYKIKEIIEKGLSKGNNKNLVREIKILDEILSDLFAYVYIGESYIVAMAHENLALEYDSQFYSQNSKEPVSIKEIDLNYFVKLKRGLQRLYVIIELHSMFEAKNKDSENTKKVIKGVKDILDWTLSEDDKDKDKNHEGSTNLYSTYRNYGLEKEYKEFKEDILNESKLILDIIKNNYKQISKILKGELKLLSNNKAIKKYKKVYKEILEDRLKKLNGNEITINFKNHFRKKILKEDLKVSKNNKNFGKPYELVLFKTRLDRHNNTKFNKSNNEDNKQKIDYLTSLKSEIKNSYDSILIKDDKNNEEHIKPNISFGYFNMLALIEKKDSISLSDVNRYLKFKNLSKSVKYYYIKYVLILLLDSNNGNDEKEQNGQFSVFINISLKRNDSKNTDDAIEKINKRLKELDFKIEYKIYKSLGPKEIVLQIEKQTIENIFKIKESIFLNKNKEVFSRSHTIIYIDEDNYDNYHNIKLNDENFYFTTKLRAKIYSDRDKIKSYDKIDIISLTTGVNDYYIKWKNETSIGEIMKYYNTLIDDKLASDSQTFIEKKL